VNDVVKLIDVKHHATVCLLWQRVRWSSCCWNTARMTLRLCIYCMR